MHFGKLSFFSFLHLVHLIDKVRLLSGLSVKVFSKEVCRLEDFLSK